MFYNLFSPILIFLKPQMREGIANPAGNSELTVRRWIAENVGMRVCRAPIPDPKKEYVHQMKYNPITSTVFSSKLQETCFILVHIVMPISCIIIIL